MYMENVHIKSNIYLIGQKLVFLGKKIPEMNPKTISYFKILVQ